MKKKPSQTKEADEGGKMKKKPSQTKEAATVVEQKNESKKQKASDGWDCAVCGLESIQTERCPIDGATDPGAKQ